MHDKIKYTVIREIDINTFEAFDYIKYTFDNKFIAEIKISADTVRDIMALYDINVVDEMGTALQESLFDNTL